MSAGNSQKPGFLFPAILLLSVFLHILPLWLYRDTFTAGEKYIELSLDQRYEQPVLDIQEPLFEKKDDELTEIEPTPVTSTRPELQSPAPIPDISSDLPLPDLRELSPKKIIPYEPQQRLPEKRLVGKKVDAGAQQRYFSDLRLKINRYKKYPVQAKRRGLEDDITVRFTLHKDGTVSAIAASSRKKLVVLEQAAIDAVRRASPFHPFPEAFQERTMEIRIIVHYRLRKK